MNGPADPDRCMVTVRMPAALRELLKIRARNAEQSLQEYCLDALKRRTTAAGMLDDQTTTETEP